MIIQMHVTTSAYNAVKYRVPVTILANVPDGDAGPHAYEFFTHTVDDDIAQFRQELEDLNLIDEFPYTVTMLSPISAEPCTSQYGDPIDITLSQSEDEMKGRLLARDVLPENVATVLDKNDACLCCELSEDVYQLLTSIQGERAINCPVCGKTLNMRNLVPQAVQEANYYDPKHHIGVYPVCECLNPDCNAYIAMIPTQITFNGNHAVYYTGGADYMANSFTPESAGAEIKELFEKRLWPSIKQFVERKLHPGDGIDGEIDKRLSIDDHLHLWTQRDFSHAMCEYWYKHGLKE